MYFTVSAALLLVSSASFTKSMPTHDLDGSEFANITQRLSGVFCRYPITYELSMPPLLIFENPVPMLGIMVGPDPDGTKIVAGHTYSVVKTITSTGEITIGTGANS
jgi:hypothetical protein